MTQSAARPQLAHLTAALDELRAKGTYFKLRILDDQQAPVCHYDGRKVINLASNNYLGLANDPRLIEAALAATRKYGVGSGAVRTIAGTMRIHMELEEKIARFKNVEACVVFQSGFTANAGAVSSILGKEDFILSDELNHASIIDGARLSRAKIKVFRHKDAAHCEAVVLNGSNNAGTGGVVIGSGGASVTTVATINNAGNAQFNGTLQVGGASTLRGSATMKNKADAES